MIYEAIKDVIENTNFELRETLDKIYVMYSKDRLSKEEMEELESLAREKANPVNSYAPLQEQIDNIYNVELAQIKNRLDKLENGTETDEPEETEEYPEYVQPTGAHDAYHVGDKITYNGKKYICKLDNCVWSPVEYPSAWEEVVEQTEEE